MSTVQPDLQKFVDGEDVEKKKKIREQIENIYSLIEEFIEEEEDAQDCCVDGIRIVTKMQIEDINSVIQDLFKDNNDFKGVQLENDSDNSEIKSN